MDCRFSVSDFVQKMSCPRSHLCIENVDSKSPFLCRKCLVQDARFVVENVTPPGVYNHFYVVSTLQGVIFLKMTPSGADLLRRKRRAAQFRAGCTDSQAEINFLGLFREENVFVFLYDFCVFIQGWWVAKPPQHA